MGSRYHRPLVGTTLSAQSSRLKAQRKRPHPLNFHLSPLSFHLSAFTFELSALSFFARSPQLEITLPHGGGVARPEPLGFRNLVDQLDRPAEDRRRSAFPGHLH